MSKIIEKLVEEGKVPTLRDELEKSEELPNPPPQVVPSSPVEGEAPASPSTGTPQVDALQLLKAIVGLVEEETPASTENTQGNALQRLKEEVPPHYISFLPKQTKNQKTELEKDRTRGIRCGLCHGWHHKDAPHVPYVGHAAVTDRLLSVDPFWTWEPVAWTPEGLPRFDPSGGMWVRLTVAGMTRLGYGHAAQKPNQDPGAREKEVIGDALRNAAMRFGVALALWHKGELHPDGEGATDEVETPDPTEGAPEGLFISDEQRDRILKMAAAANVEARTICNNYGIEALPQLHADEFDRVMERLKLTIEAKRKAPAPAGGDILDDDVPY